MTDYEALDAQLRAWLADDRRLAEDAEYAFMYFDTDDQAAVAYYRRQDPTIVLADIAGKVTLLDALAANVKRHDSDDRGYAAAMDAWELALTHLAATYVERPEFKDAWRIDD